RAEDDVGGFGIEPEVELVAGMGGELGVIGAGGEASAHDGDAGGELGEVRIDGEGEGDVGERARRSIMNLPARPACHEVPQAAMVIWVAARRSASVMVMSGRKTRPVSGETRPRMVSRMARGCSWISL